MQKLRTSGVALGWIVLLTTFSCSRPEPSSPVVEKVERAGSGSLIAVSKDAMREWLGKHKDVAYQADETCKPIRVNAPAQWAESTEGRLCAAAREVAVWRAGPVTGDDKTYLPGLK
jgi:hypothetical protein